MMKWSLALLALGASWSQADETPYFVAAGENVVINGGFEEVDEKGAPAPWRRRGEVFSLDETVVHTGQHSLRVSNDAPDRYLLCTAPLNVEPGAMYEVSFWVKTENVAGEDVAGASVYLEYYHADGRGYAGGFYPQGLRGTNEWTHLTVHSGRIPADCTYSIGVYLRQGCTGTAWFDDVTVRRVRPRPLTSLVARPNYRGYLRGDGPPTACCAGASRRTRWWRSRSNWRGKNET